MIFAGNVTACLSVGHKECQAQTAKARLNDGNFRLQQPLDRGNRPIVDPEYSHAIRACTLAPGSGLHSEDVIQKRAHEVVVEITAIFTGRTRAPWKEASIDVSVELGQ